ncbi:hypothetical protein Rhe02_50590 [Rhizocola hellebori]|uniref:Uncharacterized protein n=1 Tax=Rhizocola hellebori TaxID=1392758 RepID=A0A8J3QBS4_9ACTN|nr:hypothetical protein [Rhizocola hellebori]GIH06992.1 hypothetical protein Rhe02_50590 [Rhizocola hellebori]
MLTRKVGATLAVALTLILSTASPAFAHGADAPDATNYRSAITSTPALDGLEIRTIEAGARLQLTNRTGRNIEVLGYQGEPYLEIRPDGVYENFHSPATYLNITIAHVDPPAHADPTVPPVWNKVSDEPMYRWHDQRALWTSPQQPDVVRADPGREHHLRDWTVPMRVDATPLQLKGTLDWVPPGASWLWWLAAIGGGALLALLGLTARPRVPLALLAIAAGAVGLVYAVGRELDAGYSSALPILGQLFTAQLWNTVTSLVAIAAGIYALTKPKGDGDFALALGGAAVGLFAGMTNAAVFHRSITPLPWGTTTARLLVAAVIALGAGVAVAAMLRLRGTAPPPSEPAVLTALPPAEPAVPTAAEPPAASAPPAPPA